MKDNHFSNHIAMIDVFNRCTEYVYHMANRLIETRNTDASTTQPGNDNLSSATSQTDQASLSTQ